MENLLTLGEALPIAGRALQLRTAFNRSLIASLKYLLDACVDVLPADHFSKASQTLDSLNPELQLSGLLGILHVDFLNAVERQDVQKAKKIVKRLNIDTYQIQKMEYLNWSEIDDYYIPLLKTTLIYDRLEEITFFPVKSKEFEQATHSIQDALNVYKELLPSFFHEFQELVGEILVLDVEGLTAGSSFNMFGTIFISVSENFFRTWKGKITSILDFIVHEQAHLYVHLLANEDLLVLNRFDKHEAPLRKEKRPLIGIYHAVFVLSRMQYVLRKAFASQVIPKSEASYCEEIIDYYRKRFNVGYDILKQHAQMTPLGEGLIASSSKLL